MRRMLTLSRKNGPLMISDVESAGSVKGWTAATRGKIERRALHELWMRGDIMIRSAGVFRRYSTLGQSGLLHYVGETNSIETLPIECFRGGFNDLSPGKVLIRPSTI